MKEKFSPSCDNCFTKPLHLASTKGIEEMIKVIFKDSEDGTYTTSDPFFIAANSPHGRYSSADLLKGRTPQSVTYRLEEAVISCRGLIGNFECPAEIQNARIVEA